MQGERKTGTLFVKADYQPLSRYVVVHLDGVDVTNRCDWACDDGLVSLYRLKDGKFCVDEKRDMPAKECLEGHVEISLKPDAPEWAQAALDELRWSPAVAYFPKAG